MAFAPLNEKLHRIKGSFTLVENGNHFELSRPATDEFVPWPEFPVKVWVGGFDNNSFRWAKLLKTRVFMVTDEAPDGGVVVEKWVVRNMLVNA